VAAVGRSPVSATTRTMVVPMTSAVSAQAALPPTEGDTWLALTDSVIEVGSVHDWAVRPDCGAVVVFSGTVRDHAEHRTDVTTLEYEAYEAQVVPRLAAIEQEIRSRFDEIGRVALIHRVGVLELCEVSVVVAVSSAHRPAAFEAARYGIDALKASVPIWKRETWSGGTDWGLAATELTDASAVATGTTPPASSSATTSLTTSATTSATTPITTLGGQRSNHS
jgi:molybdopterin synthase catalytic subunit